jgi:hypothetical protein
MRQKYLRKESFCAANLRCLHLLLLSLLPSLLQSSPLGAKSLRVIFQLWILAVIFV